MSADDPLWPRASAWLEVGRKRSHGALGVVGVPLSCTSISPSRAHLTPRAVRAALARFSTYHADLDTDLRSLTVVDHGDLVLDEIALDNHVERVADALAPIAVAGHELVLLLGGDNALTRPAMATLLPLASSGLLTLDAHHDVRAFHAGPSNGTPVRGLIEDGLPGKNVTQIGLGSLTNSHSYRTWCAEQGVRVVSAASARGNVRTHVRSELDLLAESCQQIYVDLDVDVVDRAFVPGCPGARPGGLQSWELLEAAEEVGRHPAVRAVDITEVDAGADPTGITVDLAAACFLSIAAGFCSRL